MKPQANTASAEPGNGVLPRVFAALFGVFLGISLLKFGNPPIMEKWVLPPSNIYEFLLGFPWPVSWAYVCLGVLALLGLFVARWNLGQARWPGAPPATAPGVRPSSGAATLEPVGALAFPGTGVRADVAAPEDGRTPGPVAGGAKWLVALPLAWLAWQFLAGSQTLDAQLTGPTLMHFTACVVCFYLGLFALRPQHLPLAGAGLLCGFVLVLAIGWEQHFGGLEATRRHFYLYIYPTLPEVPPEYLKKISSNRVFSTLFYPNALAGALLLLLPLGLAVLGGLRERLTRPARGFLMAVLGCGALGCLYWSGSKGGWLLFLLLGLVALLRLPFGRSIKVGLVAGVLVLGLAGFFWKYAGFFRKGATSVVARFDYWRAAAQTAGARPLLGTGPGTFAIPYQRIKHPESEMARLVHNDYLEQASDSGLPGALVYAVFIFGTLVWSHRGLGWRKDGLAFAVWLGVLGWALQGFLEFGLYIPALAWPAFTLMGWLWAGASLPYHHRGGDGLVPAGQRMEKPRGQGRPRPYGGTAKRRPLWARTPKRIDKSPETL